MGQVTEVKRPDRNVLNQLDLNEAIYRYTSFESVAEMLSGSVNTLVKPKLWDDPFENHLVRARLVPAKPQRGMAPVGRQVEHTLETWEDRWYGQCWTSDNEDSDKNWRIYLSGGTGVRIKTTALKLWTSLFHPDWPDIEKSMYIGNVDYRSRKEIEKWLHGVFARGQKESGSLRPSIARSLLMKRTEFRHEKEVRLLWRDPHAFQDLDADTFQYRVAEKAFVEEILFHPRTPVRQFSNLQVTINEWGFTGSIKRSSIYDVIPPTIRYEGPMPMA